MRVHFIALAALLLVTLLQAAQATTRLPYTVETPSGPVMVECFSGGSNPARLVALILSGSKGFASPAYDDIGQVFSSAGLDACLVHFLSVADLSAIANAGSSSARVSYYAKRQSAWIAAIQSVVSYFNKRSRPANKVGLLGISLGAEIAAATAANNADIAALVLVDGGFPDGYSKPVRSLPPLHLIWGGADRTFPLKVGQALQQMAQHLGQTPSLDVYKDAPHDFFLKPGAQQARKAHQSAADFLEAQLSPSGR